MELPFAHEVAAVEAIVTDRSSRFGRSRFAALHKLEHAPATPSRRPTASASRCLTGVGHAGESEVWKKPPGAAEPDRPRQQHRPHRRHRRQQRDALVATLIARSLDSWDELPSRCRPASQGEGRGGEGTRTKTQTVQLTSDTLRTDADVRRGLPRRRPPFSPSSHGPIVIG